MNYPTLAHFRHFSSLLTDFPSTNVENSLQITPFYAKQTQFCAFFARKRRFHEKTNPIQTQFKPKQTQFKPKQTQFKPKQTQFKPNFKSRMLVDLVDLREAIDRMVKVYSREALLGKVIL